MQKITRGDRERSRAKIYGKGAALVGEAHPRATLTDLDVDQIRQLVAEGGLTYAVIAEKFEITPGYVSKLVHRLARV